MRSYKLIKRVKNDKRGLSSIEAVIGILTAMVVFAGYLDFIIISNKMQALSTANTYLSRVISNQGCVSETPSSCQTSDGRTGYDVSYIKYGKFVKSSEIFNEVNRIMKSEGIPSSDWSVTIDGVPLTSSTQTRLFEFQKDVIQIRIEVRYQWSNLSNFLPINLGTQRFVSNQRVVSTYQFRNQGSDTGFDYAG